MKLSLGSGYTIENPSDADIDCLLLSEELIVISDGTQSSAFLKFVAPQRPPWDLGLEYQGDSTDDHFRAVGPHLSPVGPYLSLESIIKAFQKYARGDDSWKTAFQWERV
jgi:hypothetical protein